MGTAPRWVRITSCLNVAQADLAQRQLAAEGIPASLENAAFLSWFWHYSNATGGVKLYVPDADAQRAEGVLWPWREAASAAGPPWQCPKCGASVDAAWIICWHCGASKDGEEDLNFWESPALGTPPWRCSQRTMATIIGLSGPLVFVLSRGSLSALLIWVVAVVWLRMLQNWQAADEDHPSAEPVIEAAEPGTADDYTPLEETILRAWQAAVISLYFFPLAFYSAWVLSRLALPEEPLRPRDQRRYVGAWAVDILVIALWSFPLWLPLGFRRF